MSISSQANELGTRPVKAASRMPHICTLPENITVNGFAADGSMPFDLDGWLSSGSGREYDGFLTRGSQTIEAVDGANDLNLIAR